MSAFDPMEQLTFLKLHFHSVEAAMKQRLVFPFPELKKEIMSIAHRI
jgi:hypothetical protein